jgi:hypothetical protein
LWPPCTGQRNTVTTCPRSGPKGSSYALRCPGSVVVAQGLNRHHRQGHRRHCRHRQIVRQEAKSSKGRSLHPTTSELGIIIQWYSGGERGPRGKRGKRPHVYARTRKSWISRDGNKKSGQHSRGPSSFRGPRRLPLSLASQKQHPKRARQGEGGGQFYYTPPCRSVCSAGRTQPCASEPPKEQLHLHASLEPESHPRTGYCHFDKQGQASVWRASAVKLAISRGCELVKRSLLFGSLVIGRLSVS